MAKSTGSILYGVPVPQVLGGKGSRARLHHVHFACTSVQILELSDSLISHLVMRYSPGLRHQLPAFVALIIISHYRRL